MKKGARHRVGAESFLPYVLQYSTVRSKPDQEEGQCVSGPIWRQKQLSTMNEPMPPEANDVETTIADAVTNNAGPPQIHVTVLAEEANLIASNDAVPDTAMLLEEVGVLTHDPALKSRQCHVMTDKEGNEKKYGSALGLLTRKFVDLLQVSRRLFRAVLKPVNVFYNAFSSCFFLRCARRSGISKWLSRYE